MAIIKLPSDYTEVDDIIDDDILLVERQINGIKKLFALPIGILNRCCVAAKFIVDYTQFQPNGGVSGQVSLFKLPAAGIMTMIKIKHSVPFTGGAVSSAGLLVKDTTIGTGYYSIFDVFQPVAPNTGYQATGMELQTIPDQFTASNIVIELSVGGGVINDLTNGQAEIWIKYEVFK